MGRINSLKFQNDQVKQTSKTGSYSSRIARYQAVNRFINALGATRHVPVKWYALKQEDIIRVVSLWREQNKKESTIEKYIAQLKSFLDVIGHQIDGLDNKSLGLHIAAYKADCSFDNHRIEQIHEPLIKYILLMQTKFGLTFAEAVRFMPDIHANQEGLWLTREITRNSLDRIVKYQNQEQKDIIQNLLALLGSCSCAVSRFGYEDFRVLYRVSLKRAGLKPSINYRAVYARNRFEELSKNIEKKQAKDMVIKEMGVSSTSFWRFLNESN